jgi:hypothetical protein
MPDYPRNGRCPICLKTSYTEVVVKKPGGGHYRTEFFQCSGCSVMFRDPHEFVRAPEFRAYEERRIAEADRRLSK